MELKESVCVVTGGARGLGVALARELARRGTQLIISDIDSVDLKDIGVELGMSVMHCNVSDRQQVESLGRAAMDVYGRIDIWLNNAGIWMPYTPAEDIDFGRAHELIEVNYFGTAYGTLEAVKHMRGRNAGFVVNILSVRALKGKALGASYSASKFAAEGFTQSVREELKDTGVKVIGVYPYRMKTALFGENRHTDYDDSMEPADVARVIVNNLASDEPVEHQEIWNTANKKEGAAHTLQRG